MFKLEDLIGQGLYGETIGSNQKIDFSGSPQVLLPNNTHTGVYPATLVVAASDSLHISGSADYYCTGTDDDITINAAIAALPTNGGRVILLEGTYNISSPIQMNKSNITLEGQGAATVINLVDASLQKTGIVTTASITNSGTGYTNGDSLSLTAENGGSNAVISVTSVDGSGKITGISINNYALYTKNKIYTATGGTGSGATFTITGIVSEAILLGNTTATQKNCMVKNIYFDGNAANQTGATFRGLIDNFDYVNFGSDYTLIEGCYFVNAYGAAIQDYAANPGIISNCTFDNCRGTNNEIIVDAPRIINACQFISSLTTANLYQTSPAAVISNCFFNLSAGYNGVAIQAYHAFNNEIDVNTPGANFIGIKATGLSADISNNYINNTGATPNNASIGIQHLGYGNCSNNLINNLGIGIDCGGNQIIISNNFIYAITTNSIQLNGNSFITVSGNNIKNNSQLAATNTYSGIQITSGGTYNTITGNVLQSAGGSNAFKYCIEEQTGAGPTIVTNNIATTAATAQISTQNANTDVSHNITT